MQSACSRAESEMTGKVAGVAVRERLCRPGVVCWVMHTGVEANEMAAVVERFKIQRHGETLRCRSFLTQSHSAAAVRS